MDLLIKFRYQQVTEAVVGKSLQGFILDPGKDLMLTVVRVDIQ
jgi:hypothetical protein